MFTMFKKSKDIRIRQQTILPTDWCLACENPCLILTSMSERQNSCSRILLSFINSLKRHRKEKFLLDYSCQKVFVALMIKSSHQQASSFFQQQLKVANLKERVKIFDVICARDSR